MDVRPEVGRKQENKKEREETEVNYHMNCCTCEVNVHPVLGSYYFNFIVEQNKLFLFLP